MTKVAFKNFSIITIEKTPPTAGFLLSAVEILDLLGAAGVAEFADGLVLNLADTLTGNAENLANFLQGMGPAVVHAETHPKHIGFALGQGEYLYQLCYC